MAKYVNIWLQANRSRLLVSPSRGSELLPLTRLYSRLSHGKNAKSTSASGSGTENGRESQGQDGFSKSMGSTPIAVQMMSKAINFPKQKNNQTNILSSEELKESLQELRWDLEAEAFKLNRCEHGEDDVNDDVSNMSPEADMVLNENTDEEFIETISLNDSDDNKIENITKRTKQERYIVGTPDPSVPNSKIPCSGCGANMHCQDPILPGYMPSEKLKELTRNELRTSICQRCHLMSHHNICLNVNVDASDYPKILSQIKNTKGLVVVIVDLTDIRNSIFPNLLQHIGKNRPLYVIGNKVDLIPKDREGYLSRIKDALFEECETLGLNPKGRNIKHVCLVSAKTGYGIEELVTKLMTDWQLKGEVFLVGSTNVGKSSVFNALLQSDYCKSQVRELIHRATVSVWPGTTLNLLKFPITRPDSVRMRARRTRLLQEQSKWREERKLLRSQQKTQAPGGSKYATLHGYIGQTDFSSEREKSKKEEEEKREEGQELVSFSMSRGGDLAEVSGYSRIAPPSNTPDMSRLDALTVSRWVFDTPGVTNTQQISHLLRPEELQLVLGKRLERPRVYVISPDQTMFVSGLGRIDYCKGEMSVFLTVHCNHALPVHVVDTSAADHFYQTHLGTDQLMVPVGDEDRLLQLPSLIGREFYVTGIGWDTAVADIQLSSLGWVSAMVQQNHHVTLRAYTPGGQGCYLRTPALLPHVLTFRGDRVKGTPAYTLKKLLLAS